MEAFFYYDVDDESRVCRRSAGRGEGKGERERESGRDAGAMRAGTVGWGF